MDRPEAETPVRDPVAAEDPIQTRFRLLVEQAPDGIFLADGAGRYLDVNAAGARMLGYRREEILARGIADIIAPEEIPRIPGEMARFADGAVVTSEWRFLRKDGSTFPGEVVARRLPDGHIQAFLRDIGERRRAEAALRESESFYRQTLESIPGMVFTTRPDGYCDYQNQQWVDYTGIPMREHLGDGWNALLHPDDRPRALAAWRDAVAERAPYDLEYRVRRHDGVYEWFRVIGRPVRDEGGAIQRWLGVAVNIQQIKQVKDNLAVRNRELEALLDTMPAMVYVMDADLRFTAINRAACVAIGREPHEVIGRGNEAVPTGGFARLARKTDQWVKESGLPVSGMELSWLDRSGMIRWLSVAKTPLFDERGGFAGLVGISIDITEHKQAETRRIAALARQRDSLVREVHHRIKNHLQGVSGLLSNAIQHEPALAAPLDIVRRRIQAIAQAHGLRGQREDARMRLSDLVHLMQACATRGLDCRLPKEATDAFIAEPAAVPLALVVSEVIANACKHQSEDGDGRPVRLNLEVSDGAARIHIRNGPAHLPPGFDFARGAGLGTGLELAAILLPDAGAQLTLQQAGDEVVAVLSLRAPVLEAS